MSSRAADTGVRLAELMAAMSIATDPGMGQPLESALCSCVVAMRLGEALSLDDATMSDVYYQGLLRYIGCNAETHALAAIFGDELALRHDFAAVDPGEPLEVVGLATTSLADGWLRLSSWHGGQGAFARRPHPCRRRFISSDERGSASSPPLSRDEAAEELHREVRRGRLDGDAVHAVLAEAGHRGPHTRRERPAGLSQREVEVLRLLARGLTNRDMAEQLFLAPDTVKHHIQHIYDKFGISTRAGATLFAMENNLL